MSTLYELTGEYLYLYDLLSQGEIDESIFNDSVEGAMLEERLEEKADGYGMIIKTLEADAKAAKAEADRLAERAKSFSNSASRTRERLYEAMKVMNRNKIKTPLFSFNIQNNASSVSIADDAVIPNEYINITVSPNRKAIKEALEKGVTIQGCELKTSQSLRIR